MSWADSFPDFRLSLTRWGVGYLLACLILGMAAVNTGNNALMALLGLVLASYVVSGYWSRQVLAAVRAEVEVAADIYAGRPTVVNIELRNTSRIFPAYGLVVRDRRGRAVVMEGLLETDGESRHAIEMVMDERGWHEIGPWRLEVLLPLGFFLKSKEILPDERILVLPRLLETEPALELEHGGGARSVDLFTDRGREAEVSQLRDFRDGDDQRQLHWKQTARQQRPIVVDRQQAAEGPVYLVVDPRASDPQDPLLRERFETTVSEVATAALHRLRRSAPVGLVVGQTVVAPVRDAGQAVRLLRPLAEVELGGMDGAEPVRIHGRRVATIAGEPVA
jgi:uncharacterized protein (DUF58 family)